MSPKTVLVLATAAAVTLGGLSAGGLAAAKSPEEPAKPARKQCFRTRDVTNFASADDRIVNVRVHIKDVYQFEMFGHCNEVSWANHVTLVSRGSDWICEGVDADLITPTSIGPQRCAVRNIHKLTPQEVAALPKRARP